jgi:L-threonylcarbamoyladenylate synthase
VNTIVLKPKDLLNIDHYNNIRSVLLEGGLVVFPTETVYGIGANALDPKAAKQIYSVKGRPIDNPLIVHIASMEQLPKLVTSISETAKTLMNVFWPGPLTLIFEKSEIIPKEITGGLDTVAIRFPSNKIAQKVIEAAGVPICAPSANISGRPSSTLFEHVFSDLDGKVDIIIDGGKSTIGLESTVLDLTSTVPSILRPGAVTKKMIEDVLGSNVEDGFLEHLEDAPKSPGMKYTHYAPKGKITLVYGEKENVIFYMNQQVALHSNQAVGVICATEYLEDILCEHKIALGGLDDPNEVASNIFIALRKMDELQIEQIYAHAFSNADLGSAIMNRLLKAAGYNVIYV